MAMHILSLAAGSKDRPPMLRPGRLFTNEITFLRTLHKTNGGGLKKSILSGPYVPTTVQVQAVEAAEGRPAVPQHTSVETILNMTPENKEHFQSEKEAIFLLLTGIGDEIYSTVDACNTANEMWIAIERLQQGESLNVQDVKTNLFWEFGKFTSRDGESMESYYSRFYKLMNELTRNNLQVTTMQVNVQFLQQLQPEWSRFVTIVKQSEKIDIVSYHRLDPEQVRGTGMQKILENSWKFFQELTTYNNNLRTSSQLRNQDKRYHTKVITNDNQSRQFGESRTIKLLGRETVGQVKVVQQTRIQCFNYQGIWALCNGMRKPKRLKDYAYTGKDDDIHGEHSGVSPDESSSTGLPLAQDTNHDESHMYDNVRRTFLRHLIPFNVTYVLEKDVCNVIIIHHIWYYDNQVDQNVVECVDERDALANLIANLTLDTEENKTILKQLKKANASLTQELEECKTNLDETIVLWGGLLLEEKFILVWESIQDFVPMDSKKESESLKRSGILLEKVKAKRLKTSDVSAQEQQESDNQDEIINLQQWAVLVREETSVNITPSVVKVPICDWKIYKDKLREVYQIFRVGQAPKVYPYFESMLKDFDRDDLVTLWKLVKDRFKTELPKSDLEKCLFWPLKVMFEPVATDLLWQFEAPIKSWKMYKSCKVHCLSMEGMIIYMLDDVEYPFQKTTLKKMLDHKCEVSEFNEDVIQMINLIRGQLKKE
ncbi:hypothetical protein Tco_1406857 [Tanacetum coccineum]